MPLDYCKLPEREILHKSPIFQAIQHQKIPQDLQRRDAGIGTGGNCGIFAEELWNHHCKKGKIYGIFNDIEPEMAFHVMLRMDDCLIDSGGVYCPKQGQTFDHLAKEFAKQWAYSPDIFMDDSFDFQAFKEETGMNATKQYKQPDRQKKLDQKIIEYVNPQMVPLQFNDEDDLHTQLVSHLTEPTIDNEAIVDIFREIDP